MHFPSTTFSLLSLLLSACLSPHFYTILYLYHIVFLYFSPICSDNLVSIARTVFQENQKVLTVQLVSTKWNVHFFLLCYIKNKKLIFLIHCYFTSKNDGQYNNDKSLFIVFFALNFLNFISLPKI